jgi:hypothetical protein
MAKPYSKNQVGYMRHRKFLALTGNAIALWDEGKDYCSEHLTDGLIPFEAVKGFRFSGRKSIDLLTSSCGSKPDGTPYAPLWEPHDVGYKMHDYLEHNDSYEVVQKRIAQADERRDKENKRKAGWRAAKAERRSGRDRRDTDDVPLDVPRDTTGDMTPVSASMSVSSTQYVPPNPPSGGRSGRGSHHVEDAIADAAGAFIACYAEVYAKARDGAHYAMKPVRDFAYACQLVTSWPDADYLLKMAELFLLKDAWKPKNEPGTVGQFLHMAPQCDAELRKHGHRPHASKVAS